MTYAHLRFNRCTTYDNPQQRQLSVCHFGRSTYTETMLSTPMSLKSQTDAMIEWGSALGLNKLPKFTRQVTCQVSSIDRHRVHAFYISLSPDNGDLHIRRFTSRNLCRCAEVEGGTIVSSMQSRKAARTHGVKVRCGVTPCASNHMNDYRLIWSWSVPDKLYMLRIGRLLFYYVQTCIIGNVMERQTSLHV